MCPRCWNGPISFPRWTCGQLPHVSDAWSEVLLGALDRSRHGGSGNPDRSRLTAGTQVSRRLSFAHGLFRQRGSTWPPRSTGGFSTSGPSAEDASDARFGLANASLFQGRYKEARLAFQDFLDRSPDILGPAAWYRLGELAYMLGDLAAASVRGLRARNCQASQPGDRLDLPGRCLSGTGRSARGPGANQRSLTDFPEASSPIGPGLGWAERSRSWGKSTRDQGLRSGQSGRLRLEDRALLSSARRSFPVAGMPRRLAVESLDRSAPSALKPRLDWFGPRPWPAESRGRRRETAQASGCRGGQRLSPRKRAPRWRHSSWNTAMPTSRGQGDEAAYDHFPQSPLLPAFLFRSAERLSTERTDEARKRFLKVAETYPQDPWADDAQARTAQLALDAGDHAARAVLARSFPRPVSPEQVRGGCPPDRGSGPCWPGASPGSVRSSGNTAGLGKEPGDESPSPASQLAPAALARARFDLALAYRASVDG